jgi:hypothetical protein
MCGNPDPTASQRATGHTFAFHPAHWYQHGSGETIFDIPEQKTTLFVAFSFAHCQFVKLRTDYSLWIVNNSWTVNIQIFSIMKVNNNSKAEYFCERTQFYNFVIFEIKSWAVYQGCTGFCCGRVPDIILAIWYCRYRVSGQKSGTTPRFQVKYQISAY